MEFYLSEVTHIYIWKDVGSCRPRHCWCVWRRQQDAVCISGHPPQIRLGVCEKRRCSSLRLIHGQRWPFPPVLSQKATDAIVLHENHRNTQVEEFFQICVLLLSSLSKHKHLEPLPQHRLKPKTQEAQSCILAVVLLEKSGWSEIKGNKRSTMRKRGGGDYTCKIVFKCVSFCMRVGLMCVCVCV